MAGVREIFNYELLLKRPFIKIENEDFNDLFELRDNIHRLSIMIKSDILDKNQHNIHIDLISKVDTTSAYVWMPMTMRNKQREKITSASVSILETPQSFRIYFDLGWCYILNSRTMTMTFYHLTNLIASYTKSNHQMALKFLVITGTVLLLKILEIFQY